MSAFEGRPLFLGTLRVSRLLASPWSKPCPSGAPFGGRGAMYAKGGLFGGLGVFEVWDLGGDDWLPPPRLFSTGGEGLSEAGTPSWFSSCRHCFMLHPRGSCMSIKFAGVLLAWMKAASASTLTELALITSARIKRFSLAVRGGESIARRDAGTL